MSKILVIDDSAFEAKQLQDLLGKSGHEVLWAETGAQGMKVIKTNPPDLILLDLVLPDISGTEICRWAKRNVGSQSIPIIMLTAKTDLKDRISGLEEGANDYITKPFNDLELKARISAALREKQLRDALQGKNEEYEDLLRKVERMAITDGVTGLFNRRHFEETLIKEFERYKRYNIPFACLMIDVDYFKAINDTYGHETGDVVLKKIAKTIQGQVRGVDTLARYGGDEFSVLLPQQDKPSAELIAGRILEDARNRTFEKLKNEEQITLSIGICCVPSLDLEEFDQIMQCADHALYKAKKKGRNCVEFATQREVVQGPH